MDNPHSAVRYAEAPPLVALGLRRNHQISDQFQSIKYQTSISNTNITRTQIIKENTNDLTRFNNLPTSSGQIVIQST